MPGGSKHIPREFHLSQSSHLCLRRRRNSGSHGMLVPPSLPVLRLDLTAFSSLIMSPQIPWTVLLAAWMVQAYSKKISFSSEFMFVFAEKEKCHSQVSLCPGPSS